MTESPTFPQDGPSPTFPQDGPSPTFPQDGPSPTFPQDGPSPTFPQDGQNDISLQERISPREQYAVDEAHYTCGVSVVNNEHVNKCEYISI
ncbi:platelet glycoprotein Ib alpha chain-like [Pygocentrus nattereri]|uniref:platelet glycoprotein Ib alpha chain-like n=1 Tax=Pygocentrus nattereri TaxID=42514 RepID=UPI000814541D|nr:platelet glycoprotein Ib alpha chain-like [Pygocentrus nattereri]